jgi:hypothetical protein
MEMSHHESKAEIKAEGVMGPLPEQAKFLYKLIGCWHMVGSGHMGDQEMPMDGTWCEEPTASGFGLSGRQEMADPEGKNPTYRASDLWAYDPAADQYHYYYVDNAAMTRDLHGGFVQPNKLELTYEGKQDGKDYRELFDLDFISDNELHLMGNGKIEDNVVWDFDVVMTK